VQFDCSLAALQADLLFTPVNTCYVYRLEALQADFEDPFLGPPTHSCENILLAFELCEIEISVATSICCLLVILLTTSSSFIILLIDEQLPLLDEHENSNKENPRNREPGCIYTIEYANSDFSFITQVERHLCIVNRGYTIVTEQE
jgi:hypothetical protein